MDLVNAVARALGMDMAYAAAAGGILALLLCGVLALMVCRLGPVLTDTWKQFGVTRKTETNESFFDIFASAWWRLSVAAFVVIVAAQVVMFVTPRMYGAYLWVRSGLGIGITQVFMGIVVVGLGVAAYAFKYLNQMLYGLVEVLFAAVAAIIAARQLRAGTDLSAPIVALIGAVYIVSRGLSNIDDGAEKVKKEDEEKARAREAVSREIEAASRREASRITI